MHEEMRDPVGLHRFENRGDVDQPQSAGAEYGGGYRVRHEARRRAPEKTGESTGRGDVEGAEGESYRCRENQKQRRKHPAEKMSPHVCGEAFMCCVRERPDDSSGRQGYTSGPEYEPEQRPGTPPQMRADNARNVDHHRDRGDEHQDDVE